MIFAEPPKTKHDLSFSLAGIPVRVHPWFWITTVLLALNGRPSPLIIAIWVAASFVSILVHEFGHALAFRYYGWRPRITLYGMGGLACADSSDRGRPPEGLKMIVISAAGPGAGFVLGALVIGAVLLLGYQTYFLDWTIGAGNTIPNQVLFTFVYNLVYINIGWGLVNLLPVYPLDGGQIFRELLAGASPERGLRRSLWLSVFTGFLIAILGLVFFESIFLAIMFGYLGYMSWAVLRRHHGLPAPSASELVRRARDWFDRSSKKRQRNRMEHDSESVVRRQIRLEERARSSPEIAKEAEDLLKKITDDIQRDRKKKD